MSLGGVRKIDVSFWIRICIDDVRFVEILTVESWCDDEPILLVLGSKAAQFGVFQFVPIDPLTVGSTNGVLTSGEVHTDEIGTSGLLEGFEKKAGGVNPAIRSDLVATSAIGDSVDGVVNHAVEALASTPVAEKNGVDNLKIVTLAKLRQDPVQGDESLVQGRATEAVRDVVVCVRHGVVVVPIDVGSFVDGDGEQNAARGAKFSLAHLGVEKVKKAQA